MCTFKENSNLRMYRKQIELYKVVRGHLLECIKYGHKHLQIEKRAHRGIAFKEC